MRIRALVCLLTVALLLGTIPPVASAASTDFTFKNTMSEAVLRRYLSRAVTAEGLCAEDKDNLIIDEDIRFLLRTGTKFVSRAALFAWTCTSAGQVENHFGWAKKNADKVHAADSEIILQGFVAEIVRREYTDKMPIPAWVFEAFGEKPETRCFRFDDIIDKEKGASYWGHNAGYPCWANPEAQRWYYYCICRYIDCGYESIHIQEPNFKNGAYVAAELSAEDKVFTMARQYAKTHARRGLVLFHSFFDMTGGGARVGKRLLFDIQGNGLVPNETEYNNATGAYECEISEPNGKYWLTWLGRSVGGEHPLGFTCETCPTILEFDNYGGNGKHGVATKYEFYNWGYDDITWFATQPEDYRNQFLRYVENYTSTHCLSKSGGRQYYILFPMRRCLTADPDNPVTNYTAGSSFSADFFLDYAEWENIQVDVVLGKRYKLTTVGFYAANRQSDGCPNGFNQEDTIREIFLGKNAKENAKWDTVVLPAKYSSGAASTNASATKKTTAATAGKDSTTAKTNAATGANGQTVTAAPGTTIAGQSTDPTLPGDTTEAAGVTDTDNAGQSTAATQESGKPQEQPNEDVSEPTDGTETGTGSPLPWIIAAAAGIAVIVAVVVILLLRRPK